MRTMLASFCVIGIAGWSQASVATQPAIPAPPAPAARTLQNLQNTTITYYDVTGTTTRAINESILSQQGNEISTSSAKWDVGISIKNRQTESKCSIDGADVRFSASVRLPRLITESQAPREVRQAWQKYLAALEAHQAADLWFVYDRMPQVAQAVRNSTCDGANAAAAAAVEKIKADEAEFVRSLGAVQTISK